MCAVKTGNVKQSEVKALYECPLRDSAPPPCSTSLLPLPPCCLVCSDSQVRSLVHSFPFILPCTMAATVNNSSSLSTLLAAHLPAVRLDRPVLDYLTFIVNELLPSIYSAASLTTHISDLLIDQELVDTRQEADSTCQRVWAAMLQAGLAKPRERKVGASAAAAVLKGAVEERKEAEDEEEAGETLAYDPFVTVKHAAASRKPNKKASHTTAAGSGSSSAVAPTAASVVLSRPSDLAVSSIASAPSDASATAELDIGYQCDALYPGDGMYYPAIITALPASATDQLQVMYLHFGNFEWLDSSHIRNVRSPTADDGTEGADAEDEDANIGEIRLLTKKIRIGDAEEAERDKREKKRQERKREEERRELERGGMNIKLSRKKVMERERKKEEDEKRRLWDETKRREEMAAALPIHLNALAAARRDRGGKIDRDVSIAEMMLLAPDNAVLLANTDFKLVAGRRYGLVGRNGIGKTTLLRQLSAYKVSGFPAYLRVQHVEQEIVGDDVAVIESVLNADVERRMLIDEEKRLTQEKKDKGEDVKDAAAAAAAAATAGSGEDRLSDIYQRLNEIDAWTAEARASTICAGLGFTPHMLTMKTKELSGGWRMRVSLASALLVNPDILLLDEPTNHLDFPAVLWLTNYLTQTFNKTLVCVSHDRVFLNDVITDVIHFTNKQSLAYYKGDYSSFVKVKAEKYLADKRSYDAQQMKIQHINDFITTFRTEKKGAAQDRKVGQVLSRLKMLEKMEKIPDPDDEKVVVFSLEFPDPAPLRQPVVANVKEMSFKYDVTKGGVKREEAGEDGSWLLENVSVTVNMSSRIGILGPNGCGKVHAFSHSQPLPHDSHRSRTSSAHTRAFNRLFCV